MQKNNISDVLIMGDYNQDVIIREIKDFFQELKVQDIYQSYNLIADKELDCTYIGGSSYIDSIAGTQNILDFVEGSKLLEANEITISDHRKFVIDINIESYFGESFSGWDQIYKRVINLARRSHRE